MWLAAISLGQQAGGGLGRLTHWQKDCNTVPPVPVIVPPRVSRPTASPPGSGGIGRSDYCAPATSPPYWWDAYNLPPNHITGPPMKDLTEAERRSLYRMPHSVRATFLLWRIGINPRYTIAAETYRRHRTLLAEKFGVDITALP